MAADVKKSEKTRTSVKTSIAIHEKLIKYLATTYADSSVDCHFVAVGFGGKYQSRSIPMAIDNPGDMQLLLKAFKVSLFKLLCIIIK